MDIRHRGNQNMRVQKILLDLVKSCLALICPFYLCVFLQELKKRITYGGQLRYEASYVIDFAYEAVNLFLVLRCRHIPQFLFG